MTKLEELKAEAEAADTAALDAWDNARADAWGAYQAELKKQENPNE
jgi:hypothetical protein